MKKINKGYIISFILGRFFNGTIIYAFVFRALDISYDNTTSNLKDSSNNDVNNVQDAIDTLYDKAVECNNTTVAYNEGYQVGYQAGVQAATVGSASTPQVLQGYSFTSAYGINLAGTMVNYANSNYASVRLTASDPRPVYVVRKQSGDARVWKVNNSDGVNRLCIGVPYSGYYDTSVALCSQDYN